MKKICNVCGEEKDLEEFPKNKSKKDGYQDRCLICNRKIVKEHYYQNKQMYLDKAIRNRKIAFDKAKEFIESLDLKCQICGENHPGCLDFHHRNPEEKEFCISIMIRRGFSLKKIQKEIKKCDILCANCHRKLHWEERQ